MMGPLPALPQIRELITREIHPNLPFDLVAARFADSPGTVVLLSGSDMDCARYHCLAVDPWLELRGYGRGMVLGVRDKFGTMVETELNRNPFDLLRELVERFSKPGLETSLPCAAGLFGYFGYDLKDQIEDLPRTCADTFLPDICLYAPSAVLIRDRKTQRNFLSAPVFDGANGRCLGDKAIAEFLLRLDQPWEPQGFAIDSRGFTSSFTRPEYLAAVSKIIQYLKAGDIYQANLAQRFETGFTGDPYSLFLELFNRNPAAFFSFINAGDHHVVSTSPERFIQVSGRKVETRPIKGTIARGATPALDERNGRILASSLKDDAELTMIVDLMRNDLSRVTESGSVEVTEHKRLEPYENVFHLVSVVKARLEEDKTAVDLIRATFPGGSITGCPKIRSMEIIDELESVKRHVYTGSIGYLSFHGTMDLSIAIRTATISDNQLFFSVGGGIVYDSDPEKEFQETLDKGKTIMETLLDASSDQPDAQVKAWINGKLVDQDRAWAPAASQAFQFGAGLFETIRVENGVPVLLDAHIARMEAAWTKLFNLPLPDITWDRVIGLLIRENRFEDRVCALKIMLAKDGRPGHKLYTAAFIRPYVHRLEDLGKTGLDLVTFPEPRQTYLAGFKTMNYLFYERAGDYARQHQADESLILNPDGSVSETNTGNILALDGRTLVLPESAHALPGVTQAALVQAMADDGYGVRYEKMTPDQLAGFSNIMITNALMGAVPVNRINGCDIRRDRDIGQMVNQILCRA